MKTKRNLLGILNLALGVVFAPIAGAQDILPFPFAFNGAIGRTHIVYTKK